MNFNEIEKQQKTMNIVNRIKRNKLTPKNVYNALAPKPKPSNKVNNVRKGENKNEWVLQIRPKSKLVKILKAPASVPVWYLKSNDTKKGSKTVEYLSNAKYNYTSAAQNPLFIKAFQKAINAAEKIGTKYKSQKTRNPNKKMEKKEPNKKKEIKPPSKVKKGKKKLYK